MAVFFAGAGGGGAGRVAVAVELLSGAAGAVVVEVLPAGAEVAGVCAGAVRNPAMSRRPESPRRRGRGKGEDGVGWGRSDFIGARGDK
jgi:hypothetical protein